MIAVGTAVIAVVRDRVAHDAGRNRSKRRSTGINRLLRATIGVIAGSTRDQAEQRDRCAKDME